MLYLISAGVLLVGFGVLIKMFIDGVSKVVAEPQHISDADDVNGKKSWHIKFDNVQFWEPCRPAMNKFTLGDQSFIYNKDLFEEFGDESVYGSPVYDERWDR